MNVESFLLIVSGVFGLIIGSFLNCLAWRLYKKESMIGRSYCDSCNKQIAWYENIPVLSFLFLGGRCRHCKKAIAWHYPLVEAITGLLFILGAIQANFEPLVVVRNWFVLAILVLVFIMDARWYIILDKVSLPSILIILGLNLWLGFSFSGLLISATIGAGFFLIQFLVSRGHWIGGGDIRLGLLLGVALSWTNVLVAILIAYAVGALVGVILIASGKKKWGSMVPLGTFLSLGGAIALLYGEKIIHWYLSFVNF